MQVLDSSVVVELWIGVMLDSYIVVELCIGVIFPAGVMLFFLYMGAEGGSCRLLLSQYRLL